MKTSVVTVSIEEFEKNPSLNVQLTPRSENAMKKLGMVIKDLIFEEKNYGAKSKIRNQFMKRFIDKKIHDVKKERRAVITAKSRANVSKRRKSRKRGKSAPKMDGKIFNNYVENQKKEIQNIMKQTLGEERIAKKMEEAEANRQMRLRKLQDQANQKKLKELHWRIEQEKKRKRLREKQKKADEERKRKRLEKEKKIKRDERARRKRKKIKRLRMMIKMQEKENMRKTIKEENQIKNQEELLIKNQKLMEKEHVLRRKLELKQKQMILENQKKQMKLMEKKERMEQQRKEYEERKRLEFEQKAKRHEMKIRKLQAERQHTILHGRVKSMEKELKIKSSKKSVEEELNHKKEKIIRKFRKAEERLQVEGLVQRKKRSERLEKDYEKHMRREAILKKYRNRMSQKQHILMMKQKEKEEKIRKMNEKKISEIEEKKELGSLLEMQRRDRLERLKRAREYERTQKLKDMEEKEKRKQEFLASKKAEMELKLKYAGSIEMKKRRIKNLLSDMKTKKKFDIKKIEEVLGTEISLEEKKGNSRARARISSAKPSSKRKKMKKLIRRSSTPNMKTLQPKKKRDLRNGRSKSGLQYFRKKIHSSRNKRHATAVKIRKKQRPSTGRRSTRSSNPKRSRYGYKRPRSSVPREESESEGADIPLSLQLKRIIMEEKLLHFDLEREIDRESMIHRKENIKEKLVKMKMESNRRIARYCKKYGIEVKEKYLFL